MARSRTRTIVQRSAAPQVIRISAPANLARRARSGYRRIASTRVGGAVLSEKHTLTAVASAGVLGLIEKSGVAIPTIGPLGPAATLGLLAWAYGRSSKSQTAQHVATGLLCVAVIGCASCC
jgi:hypothetical protein